MRIVYFAHALRSCWGHGDAHFVRGVLSELAGLGHEVGAFEPEDGASARGLEAEHGPAALDAWREAYPELPVNTWRAGADLDAACDGADLVLVHARNAPALVARIGALRKAGAGFRLLLHGAAEAGALDLSGFDGVLALGEAQAEACRARDWGRRAFVWRQAADVRRFRPPDRPTRREGLVFIGNCADAARAAELDAWLFQPVEAAGLPLDVWGPRYPEAAREALARMGARCCGWLPNVQAPEALAWSLATVHVPRRNEAGASIRVFEALACGAPLLSAPSTDDEGLLRPGEDFLLARDAAEMAASMRALAGDRDLRRALAASGLERVRGHHTCAHRARELEAIAREVGASVEAATAV
jgi:spore maturation protein CgeB